MKAMNTVDKVVRADLCNGCGACSFICHTNAIHMENKYKEGYRPIVSHDQCDECGQCLEVCSGIQLTKRDNCDLGYCSKKTQGDWGPFSGIFEAWSNNDSERFIGSSGGVCTAIGRFCLEMGLAKGVLHIRPDNENPIDNLTVISESGEALQAGAGSRYSPASLCVGLSLMTQTNQPVVVIGKPCEIAAIEKIRRLNSEIDKNIALTVSIFCGGTPSTFATDKLLSEFNITSDTVTDLRYRGHGWPGNFSVATAGNTERCEMSYEKAWGTVLTKNKAFRCNLCPDGSGESADISVGDAWHRELSDDFPGASLVLVRTDKGRKMIEKMVQLERLAVSKCRESDLYDAQFGLLLRQRHVFIKVFWLRLLGMMSPEYKGYPLFRKYLRLGLARCVYSFYRTGRWFASIKRQRIKSKMWY